MDSEEEEEEEKEIRIALMPHATLKIDPLASLTSDICPKSPAQYSETAVPKDTKTPETCKNILDWTFAHKLKQKSYRQLFQRMFSELMNIKERRSLYFVLFLTVCCALLRLIFFIFIGAIIDLLANTYHGNLQEICNIHEYITCSSNESLVHVFVITLIIVSIVAALIRYIQSSVTSFVVCSFLKRLNCVIFEKIIKQNLSFFGHKTTGDLRYLLTNDMKHINLSLHNTRIISESTAHFLCGVIYIFIINWDIALIIICSFIILTVISCVYGQKNVVINKVRKQAFGIVVNGISEMLNYITTIKTFSKEDDETFIYSACIKRAFEKESKRNGLSYQYRLWMEIMIYFTILAIIWYGAYTSGITLGVLFIDLFILLQLNVSIYQIVALLPSSVLKCGKSLNRILDIWDINTKTNDKNGTNFIPSHGKINGEIELKNIQFAYPKRKNKLVLNDISMRFLSSTTTALVGLSGSGKTTIFKLLMRFFEYEHGEIFIDGIDINNYNLPFLHSQIAYVGQTVDLFENRTIGDNIKFGMKLDTKHHYLFDAEYFDEESMYFWRIFKSIKQADVERVAKLANAHNFIMELEKGYNTMIGGEHGIDLSHGEKQRIGIARALLLDPKILLLDEAMSGVDAISKQLIQRSLEEIMVGRCVIIIAHRLKTVQRANHIYVIKNGENEGDGTHLELIEKKNKYYLDLTQKQAFVD